ncbi:MAG: DUF1579 domain-containing protein [Leptolyngbya sp. SIO4C1]|nr:DUF1579 domain-containing protein [Leptolyngbya sp. SIO4C1]
MPEQPQQQHDWLQKLVGEWTYESQAMMGPDQPDETFTGTESVRSLGGLWVIAEGQGEMCGGGDMTTIMTLGYNSQTQRYTGTWVGSMMTYLWVYDGTMDTAERVLSLYSEGPAMSGEGLARYKDVMELKSADHRVLTSYLLGDDEQWHQFMTAHYRRKR